MTSVDVAVLGAGPAGLLAAWRAALAGRSVVVLEAAPAVGGMAASFEVDGIRVDLGSHRLHPGIDPPILDALVGLLGADLQRRRRHGRLRLDGRWVRFPLEAGDLVRSLPPRFALGAATDAALGPLRRRRAATGPGASFADAVRAGLGPTVATRFYEPYVAKIWGVDPTELDAELARRRVAASSPGRVLRRLRAPVGGPGRTFFSPRRGFGQLSEALADAAVAAGAQLRLASPVTGVEVDPGGGGLTVRFGASSGAGALTAGTVWSTLPLGRLAALVEPALPTEVRDAAAGLEHRALVLVYLTVARPRYTEYDAHYLPSPGVVASRLSEPRNYRDDPDEPDDRTVLCAEVPCWEGDGLWSAPDHELGGRVREDLVAEGLPDPGEGPVTVRRLPRVYPVYRPGFQAAVAAVESALDAVPGLVTFGRQGRFVGDNTHHVLAMAWAAAGCLGSGGGWDADRWRQARRAFADHVVED